MMMMTGGRLSWWCVALLSALSSVSAVRKLKSIDDLKKIDFGRSVPTHTLVLLHWFAERLLIDQNGAVQLTFDPYNGDYGTHHYGNYEGLLSSLPRGEQYYTIGNLNQDTSVPLPSYVLNPPVLDNGGNRDRIIIRVRGDRLLQVFITQHYDGPEYDPNQTYEISVNLLRQIREFSSRQNLEHLMNRFGGNFDLSALRDTWGKIACLGLFLCIVTNKPVYQKQRNKPKPVKQEQSSTVNIRDNHEFNQNEEADSNNTWRSWFRRLLKFLGVLAILSIIFFH